MERILDAAAGLIKEDGVETVTTRSIADRAGITAPSLYRFFADREQVLDALIELHLERLSAFLVEAEAAWTLRSLAELVEREFGSSSPTTGPTRTPHGCGSAGGSPQRCEQRCGAITSVSPSACTASP